MMSKRSNRNFLFLIIGQAVSLFGTVLLRFTVSLLILDLTGSAALFGMITAIGYLPPVFLSPVVGFLADRKNKKNLMVGLDGMYGLLAVCLALAMRLPHTLAGITVAMVALSILSSFETPIVQSTIPLLQAKDNLVKANAIVSQINMAAQLAGPLLAGVCYGIVTRSDLMGVQSIFLGCAICFCLAAFVELWIEIPIVSIRRGTLSMRLLRQDYREGIRFLTKERTYVLGAILLNAAFVLLIQPFITTGAPFIISVVLELSAALNGCAQAFMGAAGLIGGIIAGSLSSRFPLSRTYRLFWIMGAAIALLGMTFLLRATAYVTYMILVLAGVVIFMFASIAGILILSAIQQNVPDQMLGRTMSFYTAAVNAALPTGIWLYGYLYDKLINHLFAVLLATAVLIFAVGKMGKQIYKHL